MGKKKSDNWRKGTRTQTRGGRRGITKEGRRRAPPKQQDLSGHTPSCTHTRVKDGVHSQADSRLSAHPAQLSHPPSSSTPKPAPQLLQQLRFDQLSPAPELGTSGEGRCPTSRCWCSLTSLSQPGSALSAHTLLLGHGDLPSPSHTKQNMSFPATTYPRKIQPCTPHSSLV